MMRDKERQLARVGGSSLADHSEYRPKLPLKPRLKKEKRARELLFKYLTPKQKRDYLRYGFFEVRPRRGGPGHRFFVLNSHASNVLVTWKTTPAGRIRDQRMCTEIPYWVVEPKVRFPREDQLLAQALLIENNPRQFLDTAL